MPVVQIHCVGGEAPTTAWSGWALRESGGRYAGYSPPFEDAFLASVSKIVEKTRWIERY